MTQQEVADRLNVSNKTISKWERDEGYPEITIIPALAELFEVISGIGVLTKLSKSPATLNIRDIKGISSSRCGEDR